MARVEALVIGGGATGAGVARDLALRGIDVLLLERGDFCNGASGGNHGMLHSGARYAVKDPIFGEDCATESRVLRRIAALLHRGLRWHLRLASRGRPQLSRGIPEGCGKAGVKAETLDVKEALLREPGLSNRIQFAVGVNDASVDAFSSDIEQHRVRPLSPALPP